MVWLCMAPAVCVSKLDPMVVDWNTKAASIKMAAKAAIERKAFGKPPTRLPLRPRTLVDQLRPPELLDFPGSHRRLSLIPSI